MVSVSQTAWDVVSPPPDSSPSPGLPGQTPATDLPTSSSFGLPGACVLLLGEPGRCLHWGRGPVSRLGLVCHKELLEAPSFPLNQAYREAQIGASEAPGGREDWPGPGCSHLKVLFCVLLLPSSCSAMWKLGSGGGIRASPIPSSSLSRSLALIAGASRKAHPRVRHGKRQRNFKCGCGSSGSGGQSRPVTFPLGVQ